MFELFVIAGIAALAWWEITILSVLFILVLVGTVLDRRDNKSALLWVSISLLFVIGMCSTWSSTSSITSLITNIAWKNIGIYALIGVVYGLTVEFYSAARRAKTTHLIEWQEFVANIDIDNYITYGTGADVEKTKAKIDEWVVQNSGKYSIIRLELSSSCRTITPKIHKVNFARELTAWTLLWPAYAISILIGDFCHWVAEWVTNVFAKIGDILLQKFYGRDAFSANTQTSN
jgi:hypothetical protein